MSENERNDSPYTADKLREQLRQAKETKSKTQKSIQDVDDDLKRLFSKSSKRPRESMQQLEQKINALEHKRTIHSLSLSDEKSILRDISVAQRAKNQVVEYNATERLVQDKKAQLAALRESLKQTIVRIHELEGAVSKTGLAERLQCSVAELRSDTIECPPDKIGRVIGKNGSMMKYISAKTRVTMNVNRSNSSFVLTGSQDAVDAAKAEIERITRGAEVRVEISEELFHYLTGKHITKLDELRRKHSMVSFDIPRHQQVVLIRGLPQHVEAAKMDVANLNVACQSLIVTHQESGVVVGRRGATIDKLVKEHGVLIKVDGDRDDIGDATVTITGPTTSVKDAFASIELLFEENREVIKSIAVSPIVRNAFLTDGGALIKQMQKSISAKTVVHGGRVALSFADDGQLNIKARPSALAVALPMAEETIATLEASVVTVDVDPDVVPRIIGKGGSVVKELRRQNKGVVIELDRGEGKVFIFGADSASVDEVKCRVESIAAANQLRQIDCPPGSLYIIFRDLMKLRGDELKEMLSSVDFDEIASKILLRGLPESLDKAAEIVSEYLVVNYAEDVEYVAEDESVLVAGGRNSIIGKVSTEFDVTMSLIRSKSVIMVRGREEGVKPAAKKLQQFLLGGDGHTIQRLSVTEQAIGVVVGKGGSKRGELESEHGVSIFISRSNRVAILGPVDNVESCRIHILRLIASARVQQSIAITTEQRARLTKPRHIIRGIPVDLVVSDDSVLVRGISSDVKDAVALVKEELTGIYECRIELDAPQISKLRTACKDPAHFDRIKSSSKADVELDLATGAVVIFGRRRDVNAAKKQVMDLLDFLLPSNFAHLKVCRPLHSTVGSSAILVDVAVQTGTSVNLDRELGMIHVQSSEPPRVQAAVALLQPKIEEAEKLVHVYGFDSSEAWLFPMIIGKGGAKVNALRADTGCQIDVNKDDLTLTVSGPDAGILAKSRTEIDALLRRARSENAFVSMPPDAMAPFLGRSWKHIKQFSEEHGVEMDRFHRDTNTLKISGNPENVEEARVALAQWIADFEDRRASLSLPIRKSSIPAIVGKEGSVIVALQKEFGCRIEIDREASTVCIVGGSSEKRNALSERIFTIITEHQEKFSAALRKERGASFDNKENPPPQNEDARSAAPTDATIPVDASKNRSSEFAPLPVGLTIPSKQQRCKNKSVAPVGPAVRPATAAGRNLFELLVSDDTGAPDESHTGMSLIVDDEAWDSSTVSSAVVDPSSGEEDGTDTPDNSSPTEKNYYKSASGFNVRV